MKILRNKTQKTVVAIIIKRKMKLKKINNKMTNKKNKLKN